MKASLNTLQHACTARKWSAHEAVAFLQAQALGSVHKDMRGCQLSHTAQQLSEVRRRSHSMSAAALMQVCPLPRSALWQRIGMARKQKQTGQQSNSHPQLSPKGVAGCCLCMMLCWQACR